MKFLLDQDVYTVTRIFLTDLGHDVATVSQLGLAHASDSEILHRARSLRRTLVTRDRDFGALAQSERPGSGVIYLRVLPSTIQSVHAELQRVLSIYPEPDITAAFIVVEPGRHRFRRV